MPKPSEENLPNYGFSPLDTMPLVELCNEAYDLARQHPSIQPTMRKWMKKFELFIKAHELKAPATTMETGNKYLDMVKKKE